MVSDIERGWGGLRWAALTGDGGWEGEEERGDGRVCMEGGVGGMGSPEAMGREGCVCTCTEVD